MGKRDLIGYQLKMFHSTIPNFNSFLPFGNYSFSSDGSGLWLGYIVALLKGGFPMYENNFLLLRVTLMIDFILIVHATSNTRLD